VAASSVVVGQEAVKFAAAMQVAGLWSGVGPFAEQDAVEAFCFAVGPRAVGLDEASFDLPGRASPAPVGCQCDRPQGMPHSDLPRRLVLARRAES
jgi:hypothetical protein